MLAFDIFQVLWCVCVCVCVCVREKEFPLCAVFFQQYVFVFCVNLCVCVCVRERVYISLCVFAASTLHALVHLIPFYPYHFFLYQFIPSNAHKEWCNTLKARICIISL